MSSAGRRKLAAGTGRISAKAAAAAAAVAQDRPVAGRRGRGVPSRRRVGGFYGRRAVALAVASAGCSRGSSAAAAAEQVRARRKTTANAITERKRILRRPDGVHLSRRRRAIGLVIIRRRIDERRRGEPLLMNTQTRLVSACQLILDVSVVFIGIARRRRRRAKLSQTTIVMPYLHCSGGNSTATIKITTATAQSEPAESK